MVRHREFVNFVTGSTDDNSFMSESINPGNKNLFPWLSTIAPAFEKFKVHKLNCHYVHTCAATLNGQYAMYIDYDSRDTAATSLSKVLQMYRNAVSVIYGDKVVTYDKKIESLKEYYIARSTTPSASWVVDETPGIFNLMTSGCSLSSDVIGDLFVDYEIELIAPTSESFVSEVSASVVPTLPSDLGTELYDSVLSMIEDPDAHKDIRDGRIQFDGCQIIAPGSTETTLVKSKALQVHKPSTFGAYSHYTPVS